ncbi:NHL repeat-containing protein 2-like [Clytia hemisphaerica]|uniref:NHL repeat containing protein n=1 Tax=Clytia hemisphaerica TaxID=252671 RepID=A0A7M5UUS4_9CNID
MLLIILSLIGLSFVQGLPGIVETVAGGGPSHKGKDSECNNFERSKDGVGSQARFNYPWGIAYDIHNNQVYVADCGCMDSEHRTDLIRRIDLKTHQVTTVAGSTQGFRDGFGHEAHFQHIAGILLDPELEMLYIADSGNNRIRVMYLSNYKVDTIAGLSSKGFVDQSVLSSHFNNPQSLALMRDKDSKRALFVSDTDNHAIRVIHLESDNTGDVKTIAGGNKGFKDGYKLNARFYFPTQITIDSLGQYVYISDHYNHAIRRLEISSGLVTTLTSEGFQIRLDKGAPSPATPTGRPVTIHYPEGIIYDPDYEALYVCEFQTHVIQVVNLKGFVKPLAGSGFQGRKDGVGQTAKFYHPSGMTFDRKSRRLFVSDQYNHLVRSISALGSKKKFLRVAKKAEQMITNKGSINTSSSSTQTMYIAGGFLLVMFGAVVIRPLFRLVYKLVNSEQSQNLLYRD